MAEWVGLRRRVDRWRFQFRHRHAPRFECPVCAYSGPFRTVGPPTGRRVHAACPGCGALERHRLQHLTLSRILAARAPGTLRVLHFAPEPALAPTLRAAAASYESADLDLPGVDHHVDMRDLPFPDGAYDVVFASHVLEHISDDDVALAEVRRVLAPGGVAILPVPILGAHTIEYAAPNPHEAGHVRAPGFDYFDRYERHFERVERIDSDQFDGRYQLHLYEDRTVWPTDLCPQRVPSPGTRHRDVVPVCHA